MNIYLVFFMIKWIIGPHLLASALQNLENHKVLLEDPVMPDEGAWLIMDPVVFLESIDMIFNV